MAEPDGGRYRVVVSPEAFRCLSEQAEYIAQLDESAALRYVDSFQCAAKTLETFPLRRRFLEDSLLPRNVYRGLIFSKHYLAIYTVVEQKVHIELVVDCRQDYARLLRQAME